MLQQSQDLRNARINPALQAEMNILVHKISLFSWKNVWATKIFVI